MHKLNVCVELVGSVVSSKLLLRLSVVVAAVVFQLRARERNKIYIHDAASSLGFNLKTEEEESIF